MGQSMEVSVDIRHQLLDHEVFPVASYRRIDIPGTSQGSRHIHRHKDELTDDASGDRTIEEDLGAPLIELGTIIFKGAREKVDYRIALRRSVVAGRKIDGHLADRAGTHLVIRELIRTQLATYK